MKKDVTSGKVPGDGVSPYEDIKHGFENILVHLQNLSSPQLLSKTNGPEKVLEFRNIQSVSVNSMSLSYRNDGSSISWTLTYQAQLQKRFCTIL